MVVRMEMESQIEDEKDPIQETEQRDVPHDLISESILPRLPTKSILRFKSVSKLWYSTLSSSRFASAHLKLSHPSPTESFLVRSDNKFEIMSYENGELDLVDLEVDEFDVGDEKMDLVGTCNGLVCLGSSSGRLSIVWNPITREFRKFFDYKITDGEYLVFWGFGYVSTVEDYKIVRICKKALQYGDYIIEGYPLTVHVYSLRLDKWRIIKNDVLDDGYYQTNPVLIRIAGSLVDETLYWRFLGGNFSFDLASEKLDKFLVLEEDLLSYNPCDDSYADKLLFVVNGCISMFASCYRSDGDILTIMICEEEIEQIFVPTDLANKPLGRGIDLIGFTRSDKIFTNYMECLGDLTLRPLEITPLMDLDRRGEIEIVSYCPSLISLDVCGIRRLDDEYLKI